MSLDSVPYDVLFLIVAYLNFDDLVNLSRVNKALNHMLKNEQVAKRAIEAFKLHTKEGREACEAKSTYQRALVCLFNIKEAFAKGRPYWASVLAYGTMFLYNDGCLCYIHKDKLRFLEVHNARQMERVIDVNNMINRIFREYQFKKDSTRLTLLHVNEGIVAFLVELTIEKKSWLIAIDWQQRPTHNRERRLLFHTELQSTEELFVRHNKLYLYYGIIHQQGWRLFCVNLRSGMNIMDEYTLRGFTGNGIGKRVCFEMCGNKLYAVSSNDAHCGYEVNIRSVYTWCCISPGGDKVSLYRTWRRCHMEGPIDDLGYNLSLRKDEATGRLVIIECRPEWKDGGSKKTRTYYFQPLPTPEEILRSERNRDIGLYQDSATANSGTQCAKRLRRHYHTEDELATNTNIQAKFSTYNLSASAYIDLLSDAKPGHFNIRVISRKRKSPIDYEGEEGEKCSLFQPEFMDPNGQPVEYSEERFVSRGIQMWPCGNELEGLYGVFCPEDKVHGFVADERSIVYSIGKGGSGGLQTIIMISFDPNLHFECLDGRQGSIPESASKRFVQEEQAMWRSINLCWDFMAK